MLLARHDAEVGDFHGGRMERIYIVSGGIPWGATDLAGGPLDDVFAALRRLFADVHIERLAVTHPADDDNLWFISRPGGSGELQIESMPNGSPPFLLESDSARSRTSSTSEVVRTLTEWLDE
jgi:hypothetical protein